MFDDDVERAHKYANDNQLDGYHDPVTGLWVFSSYYLLKQGYCCESDCRHCPYKDLVGSLI